MKRVVALISIVVLVSLIYISRFSTPNEPSATLAPTTSSSQSPSSQPTVSPLPLHTIGQVTRHPIGYINKVVRLSGYVLAFEKTYVIFSDEAGGSINSYDLPVIGLSLETLKTKQKYIIQGTFIYGGLISSNRNNYHLEIPSPPQPIR